MNFRPRANVLVAGLALSLVGCGLGRAIMSPFHSSAPASTANTDVTRPGRPLPAPTSTPRAGSRKSSQRTSTATAKPTPTKKAPATAAASQFPVAKAVPGKPGLVLNPFKPNSYIDVSGYAPGSKVKDPESQKIFVVP